MRFLRNYLCSILAIGLLLYLSFFKPPTIESVSLFEHLDKVVHFLMYLGVGSALWFDYLRSHKNKMQNGYLVGLVFPILLGGVIELLQEYATTYRGGEWGDFLSNSLGVLGAFFFARFFLKPLLAKYYFKEEV